MKPEHILPGDLIFYPVTPKSGIIPRFIAAIQLLHGDGTGKTQYSHVSITDSDTDFELEAYVPKSRRHLIDWSKDIELWRVIGATPEMIAVAIRWASGNLGQHYDIGQALFGIFKMAHSNICSTFVVGAWRDAGVSLADQAGRFIGPNELIQSGKLVKIT